jgi:hypothetical protein
MVCRQPGSGDQADAACGRRNAAPARFGGHRRPLLEPHKTDLRRLIEARPDITLAEIQAELHERLGMLAGFSTIHTALRRIGLRHGSPS